MKKAYKIFVKRKDGSLGSLYFDKRARIPVGVWIESNQELKKKKFSFRPGWHTVHQPIASHIKMEGKEWWEVRIEDYYEFNRPKNQGGKWFIAKRMKLIKPVKKILK